MANHIREIIILGSGPAGLTAALYAARASLAPLVAAGTQPGGQLTMTTEIENFPGHPEGIMGPELMDRISRQAERFGAEILYASATKVDLDTLPIRVFFGEREEQTHALVIATGASARLLGLEKEAELMGYGLSTCATCDGAFNVDKEIVVIGGGDSACEEALFLTKFGRRVRLVHRREELRASKIMSERVTRHPKIEVIWNHVLVELLGERSTGGLTGGVLEDVRSGKRSEIRCDAVFYAIGHSPNTELFRGRLETDKEGYIITKPGSTRTNIAGVFACGDVQDRVFRQAITAAGSGCMAAIEAERFLAEN